MTRGVPRVRRQAVDMARFRAAVRDGLRLADLALRFGIHPGTASKLRKTVLEQHPEWTPRKGTRLL